MGEAAAVVDRDVVDAPWSMTESQLERAILDDHRRTRHGMWRIAAIFVTAAVAEQHRHTTSAQPEPSYDQHARSHARSFREPRATERRGKRVEPAPGRARIEHVEPCSLAKS
jgi:hypothetical protein